MGKKRRKVYLTQTVKKNEHEYGFFAGAQIHASSWAEAEKISPRSRR